VTLFRPDRRVTPVVELERRVGRFAGEHGHQLAERLSLSDAFSAAGFAIATADTPAGTLEHLVEVYPHPALLALLQRSYRVPYKISKVRRYVPNATSAERIAHLLGEMRAILVALEKTLGPTGFSLPEPSQIRSPRHLKSHEEALDALVCAWVGVCYLKREAVAFGDATCAIWCPGGVNRLPPREKTAR
jgi:predicted RNase H-like nuclease